MARAETYLSDFDQAQNPISGKSMKLTDVAAWWQMVAGAFVLVFTVIIGGGLATGAASWVGRLVHAPSGGIGSLLSVVGIAPAPAAPPSTPAGPEMY